ncbi:hypothetical protein GCM10009544_28870 [Streptomyces stramineus]|uniref:Uncharacterized protein n=1 Tax=Streptomyces stramineus TaxID=173861 RepID=A0ABP3JUL3_9ACTN
MHRPTEPHPPGDGDEPTPAAHGRNGPPEPTDPAGSLDPLVLGALLARHGWRRRGGTPGAYSRWTPPDGTDTSRTSLLVPESRTNPDSADLLAEALTALERSPAPSARDVLLSLRVPGDEIHWWRNVPSPGVPAAAWAAQERLRAGARAMLLVAAIAAHGPAGYHGARHRRRAESALAGLLVGPAPDGRELTVFLPVGPHGRPVATALLRALYAARDATDLQRATGGPEAFASAVEAGVCQELTEAISTLVRGSAGLRVALHWSPAAGPPEGFAARPDPVEFTPGDLPALREAGARYIRDEPSMPVRLTGAVVRMRREEPGGAGVVQLRVLAGAEVPQVRAVLDEHDYRLAGHAHLVGVPVRVRGRLESRGGFRRLIDACGITPVEVDAGERDRLLKSLHANLDFFGEACGEG